MRETEEISGLLSEQLPLTDHHQTVVMPSVRDNTQRAGPGLKGCLATQPLTAKTMTWYGTSARCF